MIITTPYMLISTSVHCLKIQCCCKWQLTVALTLFHHPLNANFNRCALFKEPALLEMATIFCPHNILYYPLDANFNQCALFKDPALLEMATNCCPHFIFSHDEILPSHFTIK